MSRELVRDSFLYLPARVVPALVAVIAIPVVTRLIPPGQYGQYTLVLNSFQMLATLSVTWVVSSSLRFHASYADGGLLRMQSVLLMLSLLLGLAAYAAFYSAYWRGKHLEWLLLAGAAWYVTNGLFEFFAVALRVRSRAGWFSFFSVWRSAVGFAAGIALIVAISAGPAGILAGVAIATAAVLPFMGGLSVSRAEWDSRAAEPGLLAALLKYGGPAIVLNGALLGMSIADRYIIELFFDTSMVGLYAANYDIAEKTIFFINSTFLLASSAIGFRIWDKEGEAPALAFLGAVLRYYLVVAGFVVVLLGSLSSEVSSTLLPASYHPAHVVLPPVVLGALMVGIMHRYSLLLSFHKRTDKIMACCLLGLAANLALNVSLIPRWAYVGAAWATLATYLLLWGMVYLAARRYSLPRFPRGTACRVLIAAAVAGICMRSVSSVLDASGGARLLGAGAAGLLVYCASIVLSGELSRHERQALWSRLKTPFGD